MLPRSWLALVLAIPGIALATNVNSQLSGRPLDLATTGQGLMKRPVQVLHTGLRVDFVGGAPPLEAASSLQTAVGAETTALLSIPFEDVDATSPVLVSTITFRLVVDGPSAQSTSADVVADELAAVVGPRLGASEDGGLVLSATVREPGGIALIGKAKVVFAEQEKVADLLKDALEG